MLLAGNLIDIDRAGAEDALLALVAEGQPRASRSATTRSGAPCSASVPASVDRGSSGIRASSA